MAVFKKVFANRLSYTFGLTLLALTTGCATVPSEGEGASDAQQALDPQVQSIRNLVRKDPMLAIMTAEIASQRGDTFSATLAYLEAARALNNAEMAKRAVELGLTSGNLAPALDAAKLWSSIEPENKQASRSVMLIQLGTNQVEEAFPALQAYLNAIKQSERDHPGIGTATKDKVAVELLMRIPDRKLAYETGKRLFQDDPENAESQYVLAQIASSAEQYPQAIAHMENLIRKVPDERYYILLAQMMERRDNRFEAAMNMIDEQVKAHPEWFAARLYLARNYTQINQWDKAREQFSAMLDLQPNNIPLYSSQGFVMAKLNDRKEAERHFKIYLARTKPAERQNEPLIYATLSDLAANDKDYKSAMKWLNESPGAAYDLDIQLKRAALFEKQGKKKEARRALAQFKPVGEEDDVRLTLARSQQAEADKQPNQAINLIEKSLAKYPDQPDLLYERAMVAERQDDLNTVEKYLRQLIKVRPDNAHGYNALGYTWADNNMRLPEALELILKATELAPNDPFIVDSLGWVYFKMGNYIEAEKALRKAWSIRDDMEIGTHLLEVLITAGKQSEAIEFAEILSKRYPNSAQVKQLRQKLAGS